jgi:hypothetical protein
VEVGAVDEGGHRLVLIGVVHTTMRRTTTMADELRMALPELLRKAELERDADSCEKGCGC